jgi:hypothetical protein
MSWLPDTDMQAKHSLFWVGCALSVVEGRLCVQASLTYVRSFACQVCSYKLAVACG